MNEPLRKMIAGKVMNEAVQWTEVSENLRTAAQRMIDHNIRALLVRGESDGDMPGILSSKDVVNLVGAHGIEVLDELVVEDACTRPAICVLENTNLLDCINLMRMSGVRRVPVLRGGSVAGVLSMSDVFQRILQ